MVPVGFLLLILQAVSELIKRVGFLKGLCPDPTEKVNAVSAEDALIKEIQLRQESPEQGGRHD